MTLTIIKLIIIGIVIIITNVTFASALKCCIENEHGDGCIGFSLALILSLIVSAVALCEIGGL